MARSGLVISRNRQGLHQHQTSYRNAAMAERECVEYGPESIAIDTFTNH